MASLTEMFSDSFVSSSSSDNSSGDKLQLICSPPPPPSQDRLPPSDVKLSFAQFYGKSSSAAGEGEVLDADVVQSLQFNHSGDMIAVGDKGGRVSVYKRDNEKPFRIVNFKPYIQFQSHEPEFDYLKSIEIEEKIVQVKWVPRDTYARFLLSCNDKTVKLWRIGEKVCRAPSTENLMMLANNNHNNNNNLARLTIPKPSNSINSGGGGLQQGEIVSSLRKSFSNAHSYHINTISVNCDQETFLSSDDLRINLWNLEVTDQSFVIVDVKPEMMEALQEVITTSTFHPTRCNIFAYSTSRAVTKLCDMRISALCDRHAKLFHEDHHGCRGFFSEIVHSIGDAQFSNSGRYLVTRDFMDLKVWDTVMETKPVQTIPIHGFLKNHLSSLYENDCIFDKFSVSWSINDTKLVTGSYDNLFTVSERCPCKSSLLEIPKECNIQNNSSIGNSKIPVLRPKRVVDSVHHQPNNSSGGGSSSNVMSKFKKEQEIGINEIDFYKKVLVSQWSPTENVLALAGTNNLYIFQEKRGGYI